LRGVESAVTVGKGDNVEFRILGPLEVLEAGRRVDLGGARRRELLAILLLSANRLASTERLIDELWDEEPPETGRKAVQVHVSQLRKVLGKERISTEAAGYVLHVRDHELDADRFQQLVAAGSFDEALSLWRGPPLADVAGRRFAQAEIARLEELRLTCLEGRNERELEAGRHAELAGELEALVAGNPLRERLRAQLMLALYRSGRQADALAAYQEGRRLLVDELGIDPGAELQQLHRAILNQDDSLAAAPAAEPDPAPSLPVAANPLIGRLDELKSVGELLLGPARLVTVTGSGGSGKTRLALALATSLAPEFGQRVHFVSLAPLRQPELLPATILGALGVKESASETAVESLKRVFRSRSALLVLDNFEHLLETAPLLVELLSDCPPLKVLVTSRASLHLSGEHEYPLEPLPLDEAVTLFTERARAVRPDFVGDEATLTAICSRLDCLPLALELAAARSRLLSPAELLDRLGHRLELLTGGPRDHTSRQQTLRGAIAWSYELLDLEDQRLFARLAVFTGGCTLEAAEQVCAATLDRLESLVDKSLLRRRETAGIGRFWMLETIREYALERLEGEGVAAETNRRHGEYFLALAGERAAAFDNGQLAALDVLELELDNFRSAFAWAQESDPDSALRVTAALSNTWYARGKLVEGRRWFETVLAAEYRPSRDLAVVAAELARLHFFLGEHDAAANRAQQAGELAEQLGLSEILSEALNTKSGLVETEGRHEEALELLERALAAAREDDTPKPLLRTLINLSHLMHAADKLIEARALDQEGLDLSRKLANHAGEQRCLGHLLEGHVLLGEWDAALATAEEIEQGSLPGRLGDSLTGGLPWLHVQRGDIEGARRALEAHAHLRSADEIQASGSYAVAEAIVLRAEGRLEEALAAAERALANRPTFGTRHSIVKLGFVESAESALALADLDRVARQLAEWGAMPAGDRTPFVEAQHARFSARLAAARDDAEAVDEAFARAIALFTELSMPFYAAAAQLERGEWLIAQGRADEAAPLLDAARLTFEALSATPWLERTARAEPVI
jgi:predicted ATPase/DNA-binding SARP family transcriptional activator